MVDALLDVSDIQTITATAYAYPETYVYTAPFDKYAVLSQIAIGMDSNFLTNGKLQMKVNGNVATNQSEALQEISLISNLTIDFKERDFVFIEPQSSLIINARVTTGSGNIQVLTSGVILTKEEFYSMRKRILGF